MFLETIKKTFILILFAIIVLCISLYLYHISEENWKFFKSIKFYTTIFAFEGPIITLIISKYNQIKNIYNNDLLRSKNIIYDLLEELQNNTNLLEQKYKRNKNDNFEALKDDINLNLSKLTKELCSFYNSDREKADCIVGTIIFTKMNDLDNIELAIIKELSIEIENINKRVKKRVNKHLFKMI